MIFAEEKLGKEKTKLGKKLRKKETKKGKEELK